MTEVIPLELRHDIFALFISFIVGGVIGLERETRDKAAGLRTLICISLGATFFTIVSQRLAPEDPVRIAAQVVSGIGFLGAGVILRHGSRILGVTTAAVIWLTAALGMGIGAGYYALTLTVTFVTLIVLWGFRMVTKIVDKAHEERAYDIGMKGNFDVAGVDDLIAKHRLSCHSRAYRRKEGQVFCALYLIGTGAAQTRFVENLLEHPRLETLNY